MKKVPFRKLRLEELGRPGPDEYAGKEKLPVLVVLDNIRSLHNIGSVFRTCDAFLISRIILSGYTASPPHREIQKTALGATETVPWQHIKDPNEVIAELKDNGYLIVPLEQAMGSEALSEFRPSGRKIALILGNEVDGVSHEYMESADTVLEIPQEGTKHSLNVSVAAGVALWEMFKKMFT